MTSLLVKQKTVHRNQVSFHITRISLIRNIPHWLSWSSLQNSESLKIYTHTHTRVACLISVRLLKQEFALTAEISVISNRKNLFPLKNKKSNHLKKRQNETKQIKKRKKKSKSKSKLTNSVEWRFFNHFCWKEKIKGGKLNRIKQKAKTPIHKMNSRKIFLLHNNLHV